MVNVITTILVLLVLACFVQAKRFPATEKLVTGRRQYVVGRPSFNVSNEVVVSYDRGSTWHSGIATYEECKGSSSCNEEYVHVIFPEAVDVGDASKRIEADEIHGAMIDDAFCNHLFDSGKSQTGKHVLMAKRDADPLANSSLASFLQQWKQYMPDLRVDVFDSLESLPALPSCKPLIGGKGLCGENVHTPQPGPVALSDVLEDPFLYHGGFIKAEHFGEGIDFEVASDLIAGHAFFTTPNIYLAEYYVTYQGNSMEKLRRATWRSLRPRPVSPDPEWAHHKQTTDVDIEGYRTVLQLNIANMSSCTGLVPSRDVLHDIASLPLEKKTASLAQLCGADCSFMAINWYTGKPNLTLPYEIRLFPKSLEQCGITFGRIILVNSHNCEPIFQADTNPEFKQALELAGKDWNEILKLHVSNYR